MKIFNILSSVALISALLVSCESSLDKAEIDAKYTNEANIPQVSFTACELDPVRGQSAVCLASYVTSGNILEAGFMYSTKADLSGATVVSVPEELITAGSGTFFTLLEFAPLTKYYIAAYVTVNDGTGVSTEIKEVSTPDIPFEEKVIGTFSAGTMADYWGDNYSHQITIFKSDDKFYVGNLDPYFVMNKFTYDKGSNLFEATLDAEAETITIAKGQLIGYKDVNVIAFNAPDPDAATAYADLVFKVKDGGMTLECPNAWGLTSSSGFWALYPGGYSYKKK